MSTTHTLKSSTIRLCMICKWLTVIGLVLFLSINLFGGATEIVVGAFWNSLEENIQENTKFSQMKTVLVYSTVWVNLSAQCVWAIAVINVFRTLQNHSPFSHNNASALSRLGIATIFSAATSLLLPTLMGLAMTYDNGGGTRVLKINISNVQVSLLLLGIVILIVGKIMHQASVIAKENQQFV